MITGKEFDEGIGLQYFGARYYDPDIALFISPDPSRQFHDLYSYTGGNPVNLIDPNGLFTPEQRAVALVSSRKYIGSGSVYSYGDKGAPGNPVDCSGVTRYAYPHLPAGTRAQYAATIPRAGTPVAGDLVFWNNNKHVGIVSKVADDGTVSVIHISSSKNAAVEVQAWGKPEYRTQDVPQAQQVDAAAASVTPPASSGGIFSKILSFFKSPTAVEETD